MTLKLRHLAPAAVLALATCARAPKTSTEAPPAPAPPVSTAVYACADGRTLTAAYEGGSAQLDLGGRTYRLATARSGSGARYIGDGLQWWTRGTDEGRLSKLSAGEDVAADPGVACRRQAFPPVKPPAPGTPGGLPDDRTPVSEAPFGPKSPQAAANVVQAYFAHIGQGAYASAWSLWGDGGRASGYPTAQAFARSFDRYAQYDAQVGGPGAPEGAAGSIYVVVPVVIYGRLKTGAEVHEKGQATLRRVNDVPGSTAEQLKWRIAGIETRASPQPGS